MRGYEGRGKIGVCVHYMTNMYKLLSRKRLGDMFTKLCYVKQPTITKGIIIALLMSVASLLCLSYSVSNFHWRTIERSPPQPQIRCRAGQLSGHRGNVGPKDHTTSASLRINNIVLVLVETQYSRLGQEIIHMLEAMRINYKAELAGKSLPYLTRMDKGKYGVIIFERLESYLKMDKWNRQLLDKYCREYNVGIIAFTLATESPQINKEVTGFPLSINTNLAMKDFEINTESDILRVTKATETVHGSLPGQDWTVFMTNHSTYTPLACARTQSASLVTDKTKLDEYRYITAVQDLGLFDGIQRIFFGNSFKFWLHRPLFIDALSYLSHGKFSIPLERYVLIDIDDIFVGRQGTRMKPKDVQALLVTQERLQESIDGFRFNLGFSGKYYQHGTDEENEGDDLLLAHKDIFWWFPHMWKHTQPHKYDNITQLTLDMMSNYYFAKEHGINVDTGYAVAPHHSGVYPVHDQLYKVWRKVWGINVTSTEEYPHLRPARGRRGFIHKHIMVLPRQTCGLFTHTIFYDQYPGGSQRLEDSIRGGELFQTFLYNPVNVFMTHLSNYGNDRLALYTFESVTKFIKCWTNLQLKTLRPIKLAQLYFDMYPEEVNPIWQNPCNDVRHLAIWPGNKSCSQLPHFLVIGPQKTGTTALYSFLAMHPLIRSNFNSPTTFEEIQFFNGRNYLKGLDWYMQFFPNTPYSQNSSQLMLFEKSANYFDSEYAPQRAHALLPKAKLVCILINPAKRAYSWYQHQKAHRGRVALQYNFTEVIMANDTSQRPLRELRNRCLNPGLYAQHISSWLDYYSPEQLLILDGDMLKNDPIHIMNAIQQFLKVNPAIDYSYLLKYDSRKGFFCQVINGDHTKCLGRSKGRKYPPMEPSAEKYLKTYYRKYNIQLSKLLMQLGRTVPLWLQEELAELV